MNPGPKLDHVALKRQLVGIVVFLLILLIIPDQVDKFAWMCFALILSWALNPYFSNKYGKK